MPNCAHYLSTHKPEFTGSYVTCITHIFSGGSAKHPSYAGFRSFEILFSFRRAVLLYLATTGKYFTISRMLCLDASVIEQFPMVKCKTFNI